MPGSGESLVQHPAGGTQDWKYYPSGIFPWVPDTTGLDAFGNPKVDRTTPICAGSTPACCNTCPTYQDTIHQDQSPRIDWCACKIPDVDYLEPNHDKNTEVQCAGIASSGSGMDTGAPSMSIQAEERWTYDSHGRNWASHGYNSYSSSGSPLWNIPGAYEKTMTFNDADQPTSETVTERLYTYGPGGSGSWGAPGTHEDPIQYDIKYDKRGNLWSDGRKVFIYDVLNRLTGVWAYDGMDSQTDLPKLTGRPIAAYTYDGYGHRLTARYNSTDPQTNQDTLDDDPIDVYSYDHLWRVRTVTQQTPHTSGGTTTWTSFVREQWFYHNSDDPSQYKQGSDAPVMRRIDRDGDGVFEETQNFVTDRQGSVVAVLGAASAVDPNNQAAGGKPGVVIAYVHYDTYGTPTICDSADINRDGVVDQGDMDAYIAAWVTYHNGGPTADRYKAIADFDKSGTVDLSGNSSGPSSSNADYTAFLARLAVVLLNPDETVVKELGNLPLYCGYWWDGDIGLYHVRHRVYRPEWGKWIQRDPLGYAAGWNLYEYVGGEPGREFDPLGLSGWSWYEGWGTMLYYLAGGGTAKENKTVRDGFRQGMEDGAVMTYDVVTFGLDSEIHDEAERRYREGDWTYGASRFFALLGRTSALAAAFLPAGAWLAGTGAFGEGIVTVTTLGGAFGAGYQTGRGIGRVASGDKEGWWDIVEGAMNAALFLLPSYKPVERPSRLPQDVNVDLVPPKAKSLARPIGRSPTQNAELQADIAAAKKAGATDIRVDQQQINAKGERVGMNRPDLQYTDASGRRVYIEYDSCSSARGPGHEVRLKANDSDGKVILKEID